MKKRVLSALLVLCLAFSLVGTAWAADSEQATPETAQADVLTVSEETDAAEPTPDPTEEPAATATPDPTATPAPTEAPAATATPEPSDAPEETEDSEPPAAPLAPATAETAVAFDAAQALDNGVKVSVQAAAGVLPEGAQLQAEWLEDAERLTELEDALGEAMEYDGFVAVDICFTLEGEPVEPAGDVQVAIELPAGALAADADPDTLALVHFAEEGEALAAEVVDAAIEPQAENNAAAASISLMALDAATAETAASDSPAVNLTFTIRSFSPFAVAWQAAAARDVDNETLRAHTVQGVTPFGTTINLFDYWTDARDAVDIPNAADYKNLGINADHILKFGEGMGTDGTDFVANEKNVNSWTSTTAHPRTRIVQNKLGDDGYPQLNANVGGTESLSYLFDGTDRDGKASYMDVGGLLQVDELGYYYYDSQKNFAQFRESESGDGFVLYDTWGVEAAGTSPDGQFFPFNDVQTDGIFTEESDGNLQQAAGLNSRSSGINHYFGLSMSTRFIQQYGGHTTEAQTQAVTYNFSGDDDVWIFIDGKLIGDLGGIHDATSIEINFATGDVIVYNDSSQPGTLGYRNNQFDEGEKTFYEEKIGRLLGYNADTLPDNTYHTLNFFYLERGNTDSNLSLKYNLVTIPETDIYKVDQDENLVAGATFKLYYENSTTGEPICDAVTKDDGSVVLLNEDGYPVTVQQIYDQGTRDSEGKVRVVLKETTVPDGYRKASTGDIKLYLQQFNIGVGDDDDIVVMLSEDPWTTGVYALPKTLVLADSVTILKDEQIDSVTDEGLLNGTLFAVVEKNVGNNTWKPVTGTPIRGWTVWDETGIEGAIKAAKEQANVFVLSTSGAYQVEINGLPGQIQKYQYLGGDGFRVSYYFSEADSLANATTKNTYAVQNSGDFERQMSARLYIPNTINRIAVQKIDSVTGEAVNGATIALYSDQDVTEVNGKPTVKENANPLKTAVTRTLTLTDDNINLGGGVVFANLEPGTYWVKETEVPEGYTLNENMSKVIVDSTGVYADAGEEGDGIKVVRGIGRLVRSMLQFAVADGIDVSLHNIIAQPQTGTKTGDAWRWQNTEASAVHLKYNGNPTGNQMDYVPENDQDGNYTIIVDTDIPRLQVSQCKNDHKPDNGGTKQDLDGKDLTNLFTGTTIVQIADDPVGSLIVSKTVAGDGADRNKEFTFNITLTAPKNGSLPNDLTYSVYTKDNTTPVQKDRPIKNDQFEVKLKHNQYVVVNGLEIGTGYTVEETKADHYTPSVTQDGKEVQLEDGKVTGTIQKAEEGSKNTAESVRLDYTNTYQRTYILTVNKTVGGAMGDTSKDNKFKFTLALTKDNAPFALDPVRKGLTEVPNKPGEYTFELASGDTIEIELPEGVQAVVTEEDRPDYTEQSRQYVTPAEDESATSVNFTEERTQEVTMDNNYTVDFQNIRDVVIPTGLESNHTKPYALMVGAGALAGLALVGGILARRARRRREW